MPPKLTVGQDGVSRIGQTAAQIERMLEAAIRAGTLTVGTRIPTVRASAEEMRVDKNTIARAYKALERKGYLELVRGRGAFVVSREPATGTADQQWMRRLDSLLAAAHKQSIGRDVLMREIRHAVDRVFHTERSKIAFVECNRADLQILGARLTEVIEQPMQGMLLEEFLQQPHEFAARYALLVTTFYHLAEIRQALNPTETHSIVGVHSLPSHEALLKIARLQALMIGFVYENPRAADEFVHTIRSYHPNATILPVQIKDQAKLESLCAKADAIIVTQMCYERLMEHNPAVPVIVISMTIDPQSLDFLRKRVRELQTADVTA